MPALPANPPKKVNPSQGGGTKPTGSGNGTAGLPEQSNNLEDYMKLVKLSLILVAAVAVILTLGTASYAFHSGGVAECMGCHNIHDGQSASALLNGPDISSTCLECHGASSAGSYHIASMDVGGTNNGLVPRQMTPGGDFGWLLKTFTWNAHGATTEDGYEHGHSIVATEFGFASDGTNTVAPGGNMDATQLACNSCHDNHGKLRRLSDGTFATTGAPTIGSGSYTNSADPLAGQAVGAYRLLRGPGSTAGSGGKTFTTVFNAVVASTYNRSEGVSQTAVAYGAGISDWCATCHPDMLSASSPNHTHPTNQGLSAAVVANYNSYMGSGLTGNSGFDSIIPFQNDNETSYAALRTDAGNNAAAADATTTDRVMCLSCHRAHASGFAHMTRWQNEGEFIAADGVWPGVDSTSTVASQAKYAMGRTTAETARAYNDKPETNYASYQRSLCNKCHAKD
jgi:predicted CXXCH cytochrome family protein